LEGRYVENVNGGIGGDSGSYLVNRKSQIIDVGGHTGNSSSKPNPNPSSLISPSSDLLLDTRPTLGSVDELATGASDIVCIVISIYLMFTKS
jgi:hypothetical protein